MNIERVLYKGAIMDKEKLEEALLEVKRGNEVVRERLIRHYKPYIINVVGHICKRYVSWSSDETSIGLIAFNRALDTFQFGRGRTFLNYVFLLIKRDLIDYFRKEKQEHHLSIHSVTAKEKDSHTSMDAVKSIEMYEQNNATSNLVSEILELDGILSHFKISFDELEKYSPKHNDSRLLVFEMADAFLKQEDLVEQLRKKHYFPATKFTKRTSYRLKTVERHRKYLVTLILIKLHPEWTHLSSYVQLGPRSVKK